LRILTHFGHAKLSISSAALDGGRFCLRIDEGSAEDVPPMRAN